MFNYTCLNPIAGVGLDLFSDDYKKVDDIKDADAALVRSAAMHDMELGDKVLAVARAGAGVNNIPLDKCAEQGIVVFNTPGANANGVKELVFAGMLYASRDIVGGIDWCLANQNDENIAKTAEKQKKNFAGTEISGKTLGVIGLGAIGARIANDARRLGMNVLGYDPYVSVETAWTISSHVKRVDDLKEIFTNADYITVHVPLTDKTRGLFNSDSFGQMKKGTTLINFARGELVVNADLFEAIEAGVIKKYITDFGTEELLNKENIIVFPHVGGSTEEAELNCAIAAGQTIRRFMETGEIINSVNFPNVKQFLDAPYRITLINKNVPNIVASITTAVSELGINIDNIINRSKGNYAYTLLDLDESDETKIAKLVEKFKATDAITKVRVIKHK